MSSDEKLIGRATSLGTRRLADRFKMDGTYKRGQGFSVSSLGLGTYLGAMDEAADRAVEEAAVAAYQAGVNVFDTAINYRGQRAERSLGRALRRVAATESARAEIVVCTKGGFLPIDGERTLDPATYVRQQFLDPGVIAPSDLIAGQQCFAPDFLERCVEMSRANLGLETIDVYYLHNIEFARPHVGPEAFDAMLRAAFARLEELVQRGWIGYYGLATWVAFRAGPRHPGHVELEKVLRIAESLAGTSHHFRFVQAPLSVMMPEALDLETQEVGGEWMSLVDAAERLCVGLVTSSPLGGGNLLSRWGGVPGDRCEAVKGMSAAQQALQFARSVPGVLTTLSGMKSPAHVEENLALFKGCRLWQPDELAEFMEAAGRG